jgi:N-acetylglucosamine kinase-like BadF-type ATPase
MSVVPEARQEVTRVRPVIGPDRLPASEAARVLAVDGGQSSIRIRHSERREAVEIGGVSRLEGDVVGRVAGAITQGWRDLGSALVDRCVLGLTTAPTDELTRLRLCQLLAAATGAPEVWLTDDAVTAHAGALSLDWGVSLSVGTGVACLAAPRVGRPRILGGHGYLLGDEGGAFWIGRAAVAAILRAYEGRGPATALAVPVAAHFGGLDDLAERIHSLPRPVDATAKLAPEVLATAEAGDDVAITIVASATEELTALIAAAVEHATEAEGKVPVALGGRLVQAGLLRQRLEERLERDVPAASPRGADAAPLDGALLLGLAGDTGRYGDLVYRWAASVGVEG